MTFQMGNSSEVNPILNVGPYATGRGPVSYLDPLPEPLYPRGPDNTSDSTDAEMDRLRSERDEARRLGMEDAEKKWVLLDEVNEARTRIVALEEAIRAALLALGRRDSSASVIEAALSAVLKGVR